MECNPEGLSVLGYPILSDYEQERGRGAGGKELATASPSSGGQRVWGEGEVGIECSRVVWSVVGSPSLSEDEGGGGRGAGGKELATASPSSGGQRVWSVIQRSEDRGQSAQANAEGKWRLELGARSLIQRGICSRYPITITSRSRERAGNREQGVAERI